MQDGLYSQVSPQTGQASPCEPTELIGPISICDSGARQRDCCLSSIQRWKCDVGTFVENNRHSKVMHSTCGDLACQLGRARDQDKRLGRGCQLPPCGYVVDECEPCEHLAAALVIKVDGDRSDESAYFLHRGASNRSDGAG